MTKITNKITLVVVMFLLAFAPAMGSEDPMKNFSIIEKADPVPEDIKTGFESITGKDAVTYLEFLSSDLLEGRDTGSRGYDIATEFAASMFSLWGVKPAGDMESTTRGPRSFFAPPPKKEKPKRTYFQEIAFKEIVGQKSTAAVEYIKGTQRKTRTFYPEIDYRFNSTYSQSFSAPVVFVGYGINEKSIKYDDYLNVDVKGKIVMMLSEGPGWNDPESPFNKNNLKKNYRADRMMRRMGGSPKAKLAKEKGAVAIIMVENSPHKNPDIAQSELASRKISDEKIIFPGKRRRMTLAKSTMRLPWVTLPTVRISRNMADAVLGYSGLDIEKLKSKIEKNNRPHSRVLPGVYFKLESTVEEKLLRSRNVLGYIEGSDPKLKDEVVVIGAHLDHLGKRGDYIFNGADDNGSGSAGVMEIAQAFALNPVKPKRTVLFALWTGEEKGLLGSRYYVANPFFPLKKTAAYINHDMISRVWKKKRLTVMARRFGEEIPKEFVEKLETSKFLSVRLCESDKFFNILKENNQFLGMQLYLRKTSSSMGGSDHAPFAMLKVPWVGFMSAMTEDFHQPSDTVDKVSADIMEKIIRLSWLTAFKIADSPAQ